MCKMCVYSYIYMGEVVYLGTEFLLAQRIPSGLWEPKRKKKSRNLGQQRKFNLVKEDIQNSVNILPTVKEKLHWLENKR